MLKVKRIEYAKHLRPFWKKVLNKRLRQALKKDK